MSHRISHFPAIDWRPWATLLLTACFACAPLLPAMSGGEAPTQDQLCPVPFPPAPNLGEEPHGTLTILPQTRWQPVGGQVRFTLSGMAKAPENLVVAFAWQDDPKAKVPAHDGRPPVLQADYCKRSTLVRLLPHADGDDDETFTYTARVASFGKDAARPPYIEGWLHWRSASTLPIADMFVYGNVDGLAKPFILTDSVGISTVWVAFAAAILSTVAFWGLLLVWARRRKIPGGPVLSIISTPYGVASLSQFQISLWTLVIGSGIVYVMVLTGNLIDVPVATLGLLGISGFTLVASKIQANADGSPQRISPPGAVTEFAVMGTPTANAVVLTWKPPSGPPQDFTMSVRMRESGAGQWRTIATGLAATPYAITGLPAGGSYDFEVFAINAGGQGPSAVLPAIATPAAAGAAAPAAAGRVQGVATEVRGETTIRLQWDALANAPDEYRVHYRAVGGLLWATLGSGTATSAVFQDLDSATSYEFQVFAVAGGMAGPASSLVVAETPVRKPHWSDLVMNTSRRTEVDLSRVQMLIFTTISAVFTALTLINTGQIPTIPVGILALVGLSNGVYVVSKKSDG